MLRTRNILPRKDQGRAQANATRTRSRVFHLPDGTVHPSCQFEPPEYNRSSVECSENEPSSYLASTQRPRLGSSRTYRRRAASDGDKLPNYQAYCNWLARRQVEREVVRNLSRFLENPCVLYSAYAEEHVSDVINAVHQIQNRLGEDIARLEEGSVASRSVCEM